MVTFREQIEKMLEERGFTRVPDSDITLWTRPEWKDFYRYPPGHPRAGEVSSDRMHPTDVLITLLLHTDSP